MNRKKKCKHSIDIATDLPIRLTTLPKLICKALNRLDDNKSQSRSATYALQASLIKDIRSGILTVFNPNTLWALSLPILDEELESSVLIPEIGLFDYLASNFEIELCLKPYGLGPDFWTFENAADDIQKDVEWAGPGAMTFLSFLLEGARNGDIEVYDPTTLETFDPRSRPIRPDLDLVNKDDVWDCYYLDGRMYEREEEIGSWPASRISDIDRPSLLSDKKPWLLEKIDALPGLFLYQQAAWEIAVNQGWSDAAFQDFLLDMGGSIQGNELLIYKPNTGILASPVTQIKWFVSVDSVNKWLAKSSHAELRWRQYDALPKVKADETISTQEIKDQKTIKIPVWLEATLPYILEIYRSGQYPRAKDLFTKLQTKAGTSDSPFQKGLGPYSDSLFVPSVSKTVVLHTFENAWKTIRNS